MILPCIELARGRALACRAASCLLVAALALTGCAHIPVVDETQLLKEAEGTQQIQVYGAHGPLSARQSRTVLARVAAEAPNADALLRHLAVDQIIADTPLYTGNSVRVLRDGVQAFPAMFDAIAAARHFLDLEYYIFEDVESGGRRLGDLLVERSRAGVQVRVIYDAVGSLDTPAAFFDRLRAAGVQLVQYNPVNPLKAFGHFSPNMRDHRKILVADDAVAIVGGVNLSADYESGPSLGDDDRKSSGQQVWHDIDVEIRGPVVRDLSALFRAHWREQHGPPLDEMPPPANAQAQGREIVRILGSSPRKLATRYYAAVLTAIRTAQSSVWLTAAYFVPTRQELRSLEAAARRGVDVRIVLPSHSDVSFMIPVQRSYYPQLLRAGIKVYERSDGIVHSKDMIVDDVWSLVGSSNFDQRSILFNDEVDAVMLGNTTASQLRKVIEGSVAHAQRVDRQWVRKESRLERLKGRFWRLWEKLL
ncbi:MAG TPA: phospholipase D-like domain-containing protein [Steroidobacteraceae bacterium]|nr:phospholipase D-like domain-containing protein [Steroidobacteraceae bacterium]